MQEDTAQVLIIVLFLGGPIVALALAGLLGQMGHLRPPGAVAFMAMLITACVTAAFTIGNVYLGDEPGPWWQLMAGGGALTTVLVAVALYGTKPGWLRRGLFAAAAACFLGIGVPIFMAAKFGGLLLVPPVLVALLVYGGMAIANPPLRPAEAMRVSSEQ